ncbi:hypothetical protein BC343_04150 [Mucilaginibacter pedocola]|uniref:Uncharacterized protein n=1 Tax=Mucilaginibacter pedocola TaxID=1792845 RepID=A0A1S9PMR1_9SPHI|nr:hypothetical protein BC343_04150 [Mucilaginibacter pedocola]
MAGAGFIAGISPKTIKGRGILLSVSSKSASAGLNSAASEASITCGEKFCNAVRKAGLSATVFISQKSPASSKRRPGDGVGPSAFTICNILIAELTAYRVSAKVVTQYYVKTIVKAKRKNRYFYG